MRLQNFARMCAFGDELGTIETRLRDGFAQFFPIKTVELHMYCCAALKSAASAAACFDFTFEFFVHMRMT